MPVVIIECTWNFNFYHTSISVLFCFSALHLAASLDDASDILDVLLAHGADVNSMNIDGSTPLFIATQSNNTIAACQLLEHGANVRHKNSQGEG